MTLLALLLLSLLSLAADQEASSIFVVSGGTRVVLERHETRAMVEKIETFFASCSFESADDPAVFAKRNPPADWAAAIKESHVYARLAGPTSVPRPHGIVLFTEALIPLDVAAPYWFTKHGDAIVAWTKCTWPGMKPILCHASVVPHLSAAARRQCRMLK